MKFLLPLLTVIFFVTIPPSVHAESYLFHDYPLALVEQKWGEARRDLDVSGHAIRIGKEEFQRGIGTHSESTLELRLDGKGQTLKAEVGLSSLQAGTIAKAEFVVLGDGAELWRSGPMTPETPAKKLVLRIANIRHLVLKVEDGGNGIDHDHANWANPSIEYQGAKPVPGSSFVVLETQSWKWMYAPDSGGNMRLLTVEGRNGAWTPPCNGVAWAGRSDVNHHEAPIRLRSADGDTALQLRHAGNSSQSEPDGRDHTVIRMRDAIRPIELELHYRYSKDSDVIEQWPVLRNGSATPLLIESMDSVYWTMPFKGDTHLEWYDSGWGREAARPEHERLRKGRRLLESRGGQRHLEGPVPFFVLGFGGAPDETSTPCLLAALVWSGSARFSFDADTSGTLAVGAGIGSGGWPVVVPPGQTWAAPAMVSVFSRSGKGTASRQLHQWMRHFGMEGGDRLRLIDNNSWEGCGFNVSETTVLEMMRGSTDLGIELYVLDDGWFGNGPDARTSDRSGLGDWQVNKERFPIGLAPLIQSGKDSGIAFGLWFEPEMVNPRSELFRSHPEWVLRHPGRELKLGRNQAVLDLANPEVQTFVFQTVDKHLREHPGIRFVKWDCNSDINNSYSPFLGVARQGELLQRYLQGYYQVQKALVRAHPEVDFQACSAGGGRADYGAMRHSHTFWVSDNTNPIYRLGAQWNFSHFFPAMAMTCHVTHAGQFQPKFRFDVSMMGQLGMEIDPRRSEPDYRAAAKVGIAAYKEVREIVQFGEIQRHWSPFDSANPCLNFTSGDHGKALILAYQVGPVIAPVATSTPVAGLDPNRRYRVLEINLPPGDEKPRLKPAQPEIQTGAEWMAKGILIEFSRQYDSAAILLIAEPGQS